GVVEGEIVPVLCGSAVNNLAITPLLDIMVAYMPSPAERVATKGLNLDTEEEEERKADPKEPFSAFVFKTVIDPFVGKLSLFKVKSGILTADTELYNSNKDSSEKINSIYVLRGKKQIQVDELTTGDIGAIAKLQVTETGDTLCERGAPIKFSQFEFSEPAISLANEAEIQGEQDKVMTRLNRLAEEDPTFYVIQDSEMSQTLVAGVGELHLEVIASKLKSKFGSGIIFKEPKIPYRE